MAGPWFTVQRSGEWKRLDTIWISNGDQNDQSFVELKVELSEANND